MNFNLNLIIVPLIGAVIGYTTNWLAIKMLFKPHTKKHFLGIKIPFTPGLIPKEKNRIATSLGKTVSTNLLNEETLVKELTDERVTKGLEEYLYKVTENELVIDELISRLEFDKEVIYEKITDSIIKSLKETVNNDEIKNRLINSLMKDIKIGDRVPENIMGSLKRTVANNQDMINEFVVENINHEKVQQSLYGLVDNFIDKKLGLVKALIKTESVCKAINESIIDYLNNNPETVSQAVNNFIDNLSEKEISELIDQQQVEKLAEHIIRLINTNIDKNIVRDSVLNTIKNLTYRKFTFNETTKEVFVASAKRMYLDFVRTKAGELIEKLDINIIVEKKINSFSVAEIEELIIGLMKKELNAITYIGAVLGFLMGFVSLLF